MKALKILGRAVLGIVGLVGRAALLVARLRASGTRADAMAESVAQSELRDPYTGQPFEWDGKRASVVFTAPEDGARSRHEFFY